MYDIIQTIGFTLKTCSIEQFSQFSVYCTAVLGFLNLTWPGLCMFDNNTLVHIFGIIPSSLFDQSSPEACHARMCVPCPFLPVFVRTRQKLRFGDIKTTTLLHCYTPLFTCAAADQHC